MSEHEDAAAREAIIKMFTSNAEPPREPEPDDEHAGEELEATAEDAREAIVGMLAPRDLSVEAPYEPEPEVPGQAPKDKRVEDYTEEESAALHLAAERAVREQARLREHREREAAAAAEAEANRTPEQRHGDEISAALSAGKRDANAELVRSMHPEAER